MADTHTRGGQAKLIVAGILFVLTMIVIFQNTAAVDTTVLFGSFSLPLALLLALVFFSGALTGAVLYHRWTRKKPEEQE